MLLIALWVGCKPVTVETAGELEPAVTELPAVQGKFSTAHYAPAACAPIPNDHQLWVVEENGYCVVVPAAYNAWPAGDNSVLLLLGDMMNHIDPRIEINVVDAGNHTLAEVAEQLASDYGLAETPPTRHSITIDGVDAILLDNLPGQELNRRVALIHNGRLYIFFLTPLREATEPFFRAFLDSFRFLDDVATVSSNL